ncbi:MAG: type IV secretory system conjugative DNA transfer family protein [Pseudomonadota bacterium]
MESLSQIIIEALQDIAAFLGGVIDGLPDSWPLWVRGLLVVAVVVVIGRGVVALGGLAATSPLTYARRFFLLLWSPFGKSRWASWRDLRRGKLIGKGGLFLGQWRKWGVRRRDLNHHGEGHFITIAAPGGGKSTAALIPSLLECRDGSLVVTDPKGELTAITRRSRENLGRVVYLNPFYEDFEKHTGLTYPDSGFNPFDAIEDGHNVRALADNFARLLCVTDRAESNSYFKDEGAELLSLFITWIIRHELKDNHTLPYLYQLVRADPTRTLFYMTHVDDPLINDDVGRFQAMIAKAPAQWQGAISKAQLATKRYVPTTPLAIHTTKSGFDPAWLKQENVTVYILVPSEHVQTAAPWLNLIIGLLGESIGRAGKARPVTFLLDELPALGYLPDLRTQMRQYRTSGLRMWLFSQTTAALSDRDMYGQDGLQDLMDLCDTKQFFSIRSFKTAKDISDMCGETERLNRTLNSKEDTTASTVGVPLIRPEEIMRLKKGHQIIIRPEIPPIKARLIPYFTRRHWREMTDKNPYRE